MSTIPNISLGFSPVDHTLMKMEEIDGGGEASGNATCPERFSSWDSDSEPEGVGKIFTSDAPWFNVADRYVVHEKAMDEELVLDFLLFKLSEFAELDPLASDRGVIEAQSSSWT